MNYSKEELVQYRIERARESIQDAEYLLQEERWNAAANRMYYACFYIISAFLASKGLSAATHSGLKSAFNQELIKTGKIDRSGGILFNRLFVVRQEADYEDFVDIQADEIKSLLPKVISLILDIEEIIKQYPGSSQ